MRQPYFMMKLLTTAWLACLLTACASDSMSEAETKTYATQRTELARQEKEKPLSFLRVYAGNKRNMWGSTVVKGVISNSATVSSYTDVRIKLLSYNTEGKMLEEHEDVINGPIRPNGNKEFKLRYHLPRSTDSVALSIISASVAQ